MTGSGGAHNFHDANFLTFHRIRNFRNALDTELPPLPPSEKVTAQCDDFSVMAIHVEIAALTEDGTAYGNRKYVWEGRTETLRRLALHAYRRRCDRNDRGDRQTRHDPVYGHRAKPEECQHGKAGRVSPTPRFTTPTGGKRKLNVYCKQVAAGRAVAVPQGVWTGGLLLIPPKCRWAKQSSEPVSDARQRPNVLFIAVDDLRVELGCYGHTMVKSPNIDRLAERGTLFTRAYCQQALCNPSRASVLTGLRPDTLGVWNLHTHFREKRPDIITLPQLFMQHGYHAQNIGKMFHNYRQDKFEGDPVSWSVPAKLHYGSHYVDDKVQVDGDPPKNLAILDKTECRDVPDEAYLDGRVAAEAVKALRQLKDRHFFLAVGFWKPHLPFNAPKKYWGSLRSFGN